MAKKKNRLLYIFSLSAVCLVVLLLLLQSVPVKPMIVNGKFLLVEVCSNRRERERGLQDRRYLSNDRGMLFVFREEKILRFWMKDTYIPLDVAFINAKKEIIDIQTMQPDGGRRIHSSAGKAEYALEVNAGWFEKNKIKIKDRVKFWFVGRADN